MNKLFFFLWLISLELLVCTSLQAKENNVYVWNFDDGTTGYSFTPTKDHYYATHGTYHVTLTVYVLTADGDICKCYASRDHDVEVPDPDCESRLAAPKNNLFVKDKPTVSSAKGIADDLTSTGITLSAKPNPFSGILSVTMQQKGDVKSAASNYTLSLVSPSGAAIATKPIAANSTVELNTVSYPAGLYLLTLKSRNGTIKSLRAVKINH